MTTILVVEDELNLAGVIRRELVARVRAMLRRAERIQELVSADRAEAGEPIARGPLRLDPAALAAWQDARGDTWRALRVRPVPPTVLYVAKLLVLTIQALVSSVLFGVFVLGVGLVTVEHPQPVPWSTLGLAVLLPALAALPLLTIQVWLATARGFALTFVLGIGGFIAGALGARYAVWPVVPWAWPIRVAVSVVGLGPTAPGSPSVGLAATLALAVVVALVVGAVSTWWFARWEVR